MSIWTRVPGAAGECRITARQLGRLAHTLEACSARTGTLSHLSEDDFGGLAGAAFGTRTADLAVRTGDESERCRGLERALDELADGIEEAEALMARARAEAHHGLELDQWTLRRPPVTGPAQDRAWGAATALADYARAIEHDAQIRWQEALARVAGASPELVPLSGPRLPPGFPSGAGTPPTSHEVPSRRLGDPC